jgi:hypothetical protein
MDGTVSVGVVGAVASSAQIQASYQVKAAALNNDVAKDLGATALRLIQASFVPTSGEVGSDLDVRA